MKSENTSLLTPRPETCSFRYKSGLVRAAKRVLFHFFLLCSSASFGQTNENVLKSNAVSKQNVEAKNNLINKLDSVSASIEGINKSLESAIDSLDSIAANTASDNAKLAEKDLIAQESMASSTESIMWVSWCTLLVGLIGTGLLAWTLFETRRSAKSAELAANAANLSVEHANDQNNFVRYYHHQETFIKQLSTLAKKHPKEFENILVYIYFYKHCFPKNGPENFNPVFEDTFFVDLDRSLVEMAKLLEMATQSQIQTACLLCYKIILLEYHFRKKIFRDLWSFDDLNSFNSSPKLISFYCEDMTEHGENRKFCLENEPSKTIFERLCVYAKLINDIKELCGDRSGLMFYLCESYTEFKRAESMYFDDNSLSQLYNSDGNVGEINGESVLQFNKMVMAASAYSKGNIPRRNLWA